MADYEFIRYEEENGASVVRFDRPDSLNSLNTGMLRELEDAIHRAERTDGIRAVVVAGSGGVFSSGNDFEESDGGSVEETLAAYTGDPRSRPGYVGHYETIFQSPLPIIAAVEGYALAAACNLACVCDITYAAEGAEFGYPDVHMAALPGILIHPYVGVGVKHAKELWFSGKHVDAEEAARIGLVNHVVPADDLWDEVMAEVERIGLTPSSTVALSKTMLNDAMRQMGYRAPDGRLDRYLWAFSMGTGTAQRFGEIREKEGLNAAIEWMNTERKP